MTKRKTAPPMIRTLRKQRAVFMSNAEFWYIEGRLKKRREEFEAKGVHFERGVGFSPVEAALIRALDSGDIDPAVMKGRTGTADVVGPNGKAAKA